MLLTAIIFPDFSPTLFYSVCHTYKPYKVINCQTNYILHSSSKYFKVWKYLTSRTIFSGYLFEAPQTGKIWNHRMVWTGMDLKDYLVQIPMPWAGMPLTRDAQGPIQSGFEQRWGFENLSGQSVPFLLHPPSTEFLPNIWS